MDEEASEKSSVLFKDTQLTSGRAKPPQTKKLLPLSSSQTQIST